MFVKTVPPVDQIVPFITCRGANGVTGLPKRENTGHTNYSQEDAPYK